MLKFLDAGQIGSVERISVEGLGTLRCGQLFLQLKILPGRQVSLARGNLNAGLLPGRYVCFRERVGHFGGEFGILRRKGDFNHP